MTLDQLYTLVSEDVLVPMFCQSCACIVAGEEFATPTDTLGQRLCPECGSEEMLEATPDTWEEAIGWHYPWRPCEHCGYAFLFDDDVSKVVEPDAEKVVGTGLMGCPACMKLTA